MNSQRSSSSLTYTLSDIEVSKLLAEIDELRKGTQEALKDAEKLVETNENEGTWAVLKKIRAAAYWANLAVHHKTNVNRALVNLKQAKADTVNPYMRTERVQDLQINESRAELHARKSIEELLKCRNASILLLGEASKLVILADDEKFTKNKPKYHTPFTRGDPDNGRRAGRKLNKCRSLHCYKKKIRRTKIRRTKINITRRR